MINGVDTLKNIKYCYHLADLHIRNLKRHKEYREVLNKFLSDVDSQNLKDAVIFLGGDIAHAKLEMSPELVREITWFISECAKRLPTFMITGNHDCNLNNKDRLDVLTPICDNLNVPNLYYLRDTGVYHVTSEIAFVVYSILDNKINWPKASDINAKKKICLFHGPVDAAQTDIGYVVSSHGFTTELFEGFDMVLMGDIHKRQIVQHRDVKLNKPVVVYCGSIVQQNHGEYLENHGYLLWDIESGTFTEHNIHNEYGYVTIDVANGIIPQWVHDEVGVKLPKYPRLRVRFTDTEMSRMKEVSVELQKLFKVSEITISRQDALASMRIKNRNAKNLTGNVKDVGVQNQLIKDYLERQFLLDDKTLEKVIEINNVINTKIEHEDSDNVLWIPKTFEFDNMFSYGEDNKIDFTSATGIIGLFAPNTSGKSALWDALSFCIFDKCSRAFKATHIMNNQKNNFRCKFSFEVDGIEYFIERIAHTTKMGKVKVDVQFWKEENGIVESLNGDERRDTNEVIRKYLGTYEDFVMTSLSLQGNNALFIDKSQTERKDVLAQYMGVNIFDKLFDVVNEENKENAALLKSFKKDDNGQKIAELDDKIAMETKSFATYKVEKESIETEKSTSEKELTVLESQIKNTIGVIDINDVETDLVLANSEITVISQKRDKMKSQFAQTETIIDSLKQRKKELELFNSIDIETAYDEYNSSLKQLDKLQKNVDIYGEKLLTQKEKLVHLSKHEYDPNCKFCVNNVFVKDAHDTKKVVDDMEITLNKMKEDVSTLDRHLLTYTQNDIVAKYKEYKESEKELNNTITLHSRIKAEMMSSELKIKNEQDKIVNLTAQVEKYNKNKEQIELNIELNRKIDALKKQMSTLKAKLRTSDDLILKSNSNLSKYKTEKAAIEDMIKKVKDLEEQNKLYDYYLDAVKRDGVSYELISKTLPTIEGEVNNILGQIVEFQMNLQMDGKNVNAFIVYGDDRTWPLEMCSGMERFISGLAIRIALINICNLPRPNFLVIDEGFGTLDAENLQSLFMAFAYLKTQFDFVVIISHIDSMRDVVDNLIEIKKENGFSSVRF